MCSSYQKDKNSKNLLKKYILIPLSWLFLAICISVYLSASVGVLLIGNWVERFVGGFMTAVLIFATFGEFPQMWKNHRPYAILILSLTVSSILATTYFLMIA